MATCNQLVFRSVLESLAQVDLHGKPLVRAIEELSEHYKNRGATDVTYETELYRYGYVYAYFLYNCNLVETFLRITEALGLWLRAYKESVGGILNVCSVGGGPGTDIFAIRRYLKNQNIQLEVSGHVLDRNVEWKETHDNLQGKMFPELENDVTYGYFDFEKELDEIAIVEIRKANIISVVRFVSEVCKAHWMDCSEKLKRILDHARIGTIIIFADTVIDDVIENALAGGNYEKVKEVQQFTGTFSVVSQTEKNLVKANVEKFENRYPVYSVENMKASLYMKVKND